MAIEKCFALYFPLQSKSICTVGNAKKVTLVSAVVLFAFDSQFLFIFDTIIISNGEKRCVWLPVIDGYKIIFAYIDNSLYSFVPLTVMFIANHLIIIKFLIAVWNTAYGGTQSVHQALSKSAVRGSVMLVTVSFAFIILTGPISIAYTIMDNPPIMVYGVTVILQYLNHSINGVLYSISGSRFRKELMKLFGCCKIGTPTRSNVITNTNTEVSAVSAPVVTGANQV